MTEPAPSIEQFLRVMEVLLSGARKMSPFEENTYFDTPVPKTIVVQPATAGTIVAANPRRLGLIMGVPINGPNVSVAPDGLQASATDGFTISASIMPLMLLQKDWGPIVTMGWTGFSAGVGNGSVFLLELVLREWPAKGG